MFLTLRLFNSVLFVVGNVSIAFYTLRRFYQAMKTHYQLVNEVDQFSVLVEESRESLEYVGNRIVEAMNEIENDIGTELSVTHDLTELNSNINSMTRRFNEVEEGIIELARLNYDVENATVETPADISEEVRNIFNALKLKNKESSQNAEQQQSDRRRGITKRSTKDSKDNKITSIVKKKSSHDKDNRVPKMAWEKPRSPSPSSTKRTNDKSAINNSNNLPTNGKNEVKSTNYRNKSATRSKSPSNAIAPEVKLLQSEARNNHQIVAADKPVGYRPTWTFE